MGIVSKEAAEAVAKVFLERRPVLLRYASSMTRNVRGVDPEDVVQQAYYRAVRVYRPGTGRGGIYTVLGHACRTVAIDKIRKAKKYADKSHAAVLLTESKGITPRGGATFQALGFEDTIDDSRTGVDDAEVLMVFEKLEAKMLESYRGVLPLNYFGFSIEEAAAIMGISKGAYKSRLYRARAQAQEILGPSHQFESIPRPDIRIVR